MAPRIASAVHTVAARPADATSIRPGGISPREARFGFARWRHGRDRMTSSSTCSAPLAIPFAGPAAGSRSTSVGNPASPRSSFSKSVVFRFVNCAPPNATVIGRTVHWSSWVEALTPTANFSDLGSSRWRGRLTKQSRFHWLSRPREVSRSESLSVPCLSLNNLPIPFRQKNLPVHPI
jgi:hypothetical protein